MCVRRGSSVRNYVKRVTLMKGEKVTERGMTVTYVITYQPKGSMALHRGFVLLVFECPGESTEQMWVT